MSSDLKKLMKLHTIYSTLGTTFVMFGTWVATPALIMLLVKFPYNIIISIVYYIIATIIFRRISQINKEIIKQRMGLLQSQNILNTTQK